MSKAKFTTVKALITEKKYDEARRILKTIDHPTAREWETKLDKIAPLNARIETQKIGNRRIYIGLGGGVLILVIVMILGLALQNQNSNIPIPTVTRQADVGFLATQTQTEVVDPTVTMTATSIPETEQPTVTNTELPIPTATHTDLPAMTATLQLTPMELAIYYTMSSVDLRSCPQVECPVVEQVASGLSLSVRGSVAGQEIDAGNSKWYLVERAGTSDEYVYNKFLSSSPKLRPQQQPASPIVPTSALSEGGFRCKDGTQGQGTNPQTACSHHGGIG